MSYHSPSIFSYTTGSRVSISEIYDEFRRHINSLLNLQSEAHHAIQDWSSGLTKQIRDHADKQKCLVDEAYNVQLKHLESMRDQFVETNSIYQRKNDTEEINRLLERCRTLKVDLVNLKFPSNNIEFIEVTKVEPQELMEPEELNPRKTGDDKFESRRPERDDNVPVHDRDFNSSSYSKSTASASNRTDQSLTTQSPYNSDRPRDTNDYNTSKTDFKDDDNNSIDKCPMCFMIFPTNMSATARTMHVDEHYKDE